MSNEHLDAMTVAYMSGFADGKRAAKVVPEGYVLVPVEPTKEMIEAYLDQDGRFASARQDWAVMLAAAPSKEGQ